MAEINFGPAIGAEFPAPGGTAQIFTGGIKLTGPAPMRVAFRFPKIGRPSIAEAGKPIFDESAVTFESGPWPDFLSVLQSIFDSRLALAPVGGGKPVKMTLGSAKPVKEVGTGVLLATTVNAVLAERVLYDVAVLKPDGGFQVIAPHCLYFRSNWQDFGIAHTTDIHVSRRIDQFAPRLMAKGRTDAARKLVNFNDRFRGFIKYANFLHREGKLDVILATGDIIDYQTEKDDDPAVNPGGNAQFMLDLLRGRIASSTMPQVEELRVPIFMTTGNHDYRRFPYSLLFKLAGVHTVDSTDAFRLSHEDALAVEGLSEKPNLGTEVARRMVLVDKDLPGYRQYLADETNYIVKLGSHRVAMLDSGPDVGLPSTADAVLDFFGFAGEDESTAIGGSPNSEGLSEAVLRLVERGLDDPTATGLFIVGLHAPLFSPWNAEYPYFLRETQRAEQKDQVYGWLSRHHMALGVDRLRELHRSWFGNGANADAVQYLKRGDPNDLLDYGVTRVNAHNLLKAVAGIGRRRKADVVLHGHVHRYCDFRLEVEGGELAYLMDFYTENFAHYYPAKYLTRYLPPVTPGSVIPIPESRLTYVHMDDDAPANNQPSAMAHRDDQSVVIIPPYSKPLRTAPDARAWWEEHRPLVLQTEALGPFQDGNANLGGFRLLVVKNDVIDKIHFMSIEALHAFNYELPFERMITPDPQMSFKHVVRSKEFGKVTVVGDPVGYILPTLGLQNLLYRSVTGNILELTRAKSGQRGAGDVSAAIRAPKAAGDPSCYYDSASGKIIVPYRGTDGHVHTMYWATGDVGTDALSKPVKAPPAAGRPFGLHNALKNSHMVVYRSADGDLQALSWQGASAPLHENLTSGANALKSAGDPSPYLDTTRNTNIVVYRAVDGHIRSIFWSVGGSGLDDLSGVARSPKAAGDPMAYYSAADDRHQVVYRAADGHVWELHWLGVFTVSATDLTAQAGAPVAESEPWAWSDQQNVKHVVYRGTDDHVIEIHRAQNGVLSWFDLTLEGVATRAAGRVHGFSGPDYQHVVYRGVDGEIHEIRWGRVSTPTAATAAGS